MLELVRLIEDVQVKRLAILVLSIVLRTAALEAADCQSIGGGDVDHAGIDTPAGLDASALCKSTALADTYLEGVNQGLAIDCATVSGQVSMIGQRAAMPIRLRFCMSYISEVLT